MQVTLETVSQISYRWVEAELRVKGASNIDVASDAVILHEAPLGYEVYCVVTDPFTRVNDDYILSTRYVRS